LTVILVVGAALRFHALGQDRRFHPDEAWFSTFARHAALNGDWLLHGPLDKTPLSIYASALSMTLFVTHTDELNLLDFNVYQGEFAARLPNVFASILQIAIVYALARRL
jgi:4-amino-4-deoxy-L-arabinose transferase-like glycosyltransferase